MCPLPPFSMMEQPLDVATPCRDMRHFEKKELTELRFGARMGSGVCPQQGLKSWWATVVLCHPGLLMLTSSFSQAEQSSEA